MVALMFYLCKVNKNLFSLYTFYMIPITKFARQKSKLAGIVRVSFFVTKVNIDLWDRDQPGRPHIGHWWSKKSSRLPYEEGGFLISMP